MKRHAFVKGVLLACLPLALLHASWLADEASAEERIIVHSSFSPDRLNTSTTFGFSVQVQDTTEVVPPPLTYVNVRLPAGMGIANSTLGLAMCSSDALLLFGTTGCPPNSFVGSGEALVEIQLGSVLTVKTHVSVFMAPPERETTVLLFYAESTTPVFAQMVLPAELLPEKSGPYGGRIDTLVPIMGTVPDGPNVSVVRFDASIGPRGLRYYRRIHGRLVSFQPTGVMIPATCPKDGFKFLIELGFENGTKAHAVGVVPCPPSSHRRT